jgi:short-subunit dehydrogenase
MDAIRRQFEVNVFGLIETIKAVLPGMRAHGSGAIVNIASAGGRMTYPLGTLYHGSKWAVEGLSEALHYKLAALGIRVKIWDAVTDGTTQLRYVCGTGAKTLLGQRYSIEQDEAFVAGMRARFGL